MKIVLSPAKSLDFESKLPTSKITEAQFLSQSHRINKLLKTKSVKSLSKLMNISEALGQLNYERNQEWELPFTEDNARQAIYAFSGDVYRGFDAYSIPIDKLDIVQDKVRILSGLYGILKPFDLIQPYRLEMGTSLAVGTAKNLYEFWKKDIVKSLNEEFGKKLGDNEFLINLASQEYSKAIDVKQLNVPVINVDFKELKNDSYKIIAIFAKLARGAMARYIIYTNDETLEDIKGFDYENYRYHEALSNENHMVFTR